MPSKKSISDAHKYIKLNRDDLIPYANNPRTHSESQVNQIAASIREFGFVVPVIVDEDHGIIAGHGRILAAKKLNLEIIPCIMLSGLSKAQKKAYTIADNQLPMNADWIFEMLKNEIDGLEEMDFDIDLLGFDDGFMNSLNIDFENVKGYQNKEIDFDDFDEAMILKISLSPENYESVKSALLNLGETLESGLLSVLGLDV